MSKEDLFQDWCEDNDLCQDEDAFDRFLDEYGGNDCFCDEYDDKQIEHNCHIKGKTKMKVKILSENGGNALQTKINNFLEQDNNSEKLVDIKYTMVVNNSTKTNFPVIFSAMIILKNN